MLINSTVNRFFRFLLIVIDSFLRPLVAAPPSVSSDPLPHPSLPQQNPSRLLTPEEHDYIRQRAYYDAFLAIQAANPGFFIDPGLIPPMPSILVPSGQQVPLPRFQPLPSQASIPTPQTTPPSKAPSKRTPKANLAKAARTTAAPYITQSPTESSTSSSPSPSPSRKRVGKKAYGVMELHPYMWDIIARGPANNFDGPKPRQSEVGAPKRYILEQFSGLEGAKQHLLESKEKRTSLRDKVAEGAKRRSKKDGRKDVFCFIEGCGQCFGRVEKVARHLATTKRHKDIKRKLIPLHLYLFGNSSVC